MAGEIIRPSALTTERTSPVASEWMVTDNGSTVAKVTIQKVVEAGRPTATQAEAEAGTDPSKAMTPLTTKQAIQAQGDIRFASAAQGELADSAVQPGDLATVATTGAYNDLTGKPTLGTAAAQNSSAFASAAQGLLAVSALQSLTAGANITIDDTDPQNPIVSGSGGVSDGDKGDVEVSGGGVDWIVPRLTISSRAAAIADFHPAQAPLFIRTAGYSATGDQGGALYKKVASEPAHPGKLSITLTNSTVVWFEICEVVLTPQMFGAAGDGTTNDAPALQDFANAVILRRGCGLVPPKTYKVNTQINLLGQITGAGEKSVRFDAYGAVFDATQVAICFYVSDWGSANKLNWCGGTIRQNNSAISTHGILIEKSGHHRFEDMIFYGGRPVGGSLNTSYAAIHIRQQNLTNQDTGAFWTMIRGCIFTGDHAGGTGNNLTNGLPYAIWMRGAANATTIVDCQFERTVRPIYIQPDNNGYMANGVLIDGNHFENVQNGVIINGNSTGRTPGGLRIVNNRAEAIPEAFINITSTTGNPQFSTPPAMGFNFIESAVLTTIYNPDNRRVQILDMSNKTEGGAVFSAATAVSVSIPDPSWGIVGTNYRVSIEAPNNNRWSVSSKTQNSFTISTDVAYTGTVRWGIEYYA